MRLTKYCKSDGEGWMVIRIRCAKTVSYDRLNKLMAQNGWVRWSLLRDRFNELKKKCAKTDPIKFPNWKEVVIPMRAATRADMPSGIHRDKDTEILLENTNESIAANETSESATKIATPEESPTEQPSLFQSSPAATPAVSTANNEFNSIRASDIERFRNAGRISKPK